MPTRCVSRSREMRRAPQRAPEGLAAPLGRERGSVSAEFAAVIPAVLLVLAFGLGAVEVVVQQARLTDAAADSARSLARGDGDGVMHARMARTVGSASVSVRRDTDFVCVSLVQAAAGPASLTGLSVHGESCALGNDPGNVEKG
jgi:Flp pilus assembly protein TadG